MTKLQTAQKQASDEDAGAIAADAGVIAVDGGVITLELYTTPHAGMHVLLPIGINLEALDRSRIDRWTFTSAPETTDSLIATHQALRRRLQEIASGDGRYKPYQPDPSPVRLSAAENALYYNLCFAEEHLVALQRPGDRPGSEPPVTGAALRTAIRELPPHILDYYVSAMSASHGLTEDRYQRVIKSVMLPPEAAAEAPEARETTAAQEAA